MDRAKDKFDKIDAEFGKTFGRSYGGQIEEYRCEDADVVVVTSGSTTGTVRAVVDAQREKGRKVGVVKLRMYRPFPREKLAKALKGKKAIGVLDRAVGFGWNTGPVYMETRAISPEIGNVPMLSFIDGLANMDITVPHIERIISDLFDAAQGKPYQETCWIALEEQ
jgi:pyruvate/2-oxoacid:ferredoxin oxidoreductase alpha subunit